MELHIEGFKDDSLDIKTQHTHTHIVLCDFVQGLSTDISQEQNSSLLGEGFEDRMWAVQHCAALTQVIVTSVNSWPCQPRTQHFPIPPSPLTLKFFPPSLL